MALSDLTRQEILLATQECDLLGRDAFLAKYSFGQARSCLLVHDGKTYDSKAIVGAAHGFLPGRSALTAGDFSGGAATVGRLLANLGFEVRTDAGTTLTTNQLLDKIAKLHPYKSPDGRTAAYQPITLLWAIGQDTARAPAHGIVDPYTERTEPTPRAARRIPPRPIPSRRCTARACGTSTAQCNSTVRLVRRAPAVRRADS
jgi:5-methylcytosine-specific restriction enzyme A